MALLNLTTLRTTAYSLSANDTLMIGRTGTLSVASDAITGSQDGIDVINHGVIFSQNTAIDINGSFGTLTNFGEISSLGSFSAVELGTGGKTGFWEVTNAGRIVGSQSAGGLAVFSGGNQIVNSGEIIGNGLRAIEIGSNFDAGNLPNLIINTGLIASSNPTIQAFWQTGDGDPTTIINSGEIIGDIEFGGFDDTYDGRGGTIVGEVRGEAGNDTYILDDPDTEIVENAGEGVDTVKIGSNFTLAANFENLQLLGGEDFDGYGNNAANNVWGNAGQNRLYGEAGDDTIFGAGGSDRGFGGIGDDTVEGGRGNDQLFGEAGNDTLRGNDGNDRLLGGSGNDSLGGGNGDDTLFGGGGFDTLVGSTGNDTLTGDGNADKFIFTDFGGGFGNDVITDFEANNNAEDINLAGVSAITNFADLTANHMSQVGANVVIDDLAGNTITVLNVNLAQMNAADFIF